ncbi:ASCH/PUA domain-containing protein [Aeromonas hydrophila]|uniref:ASCH/PUA domain-containing protein n=1 Tax=Aeromonas hydrophila TaxID=644 RepID=UPI002B45BB96|nr:ASCH/PUA domain-containing protein [Aeromonas hydrophila]
MKHELKIKPEYFAAVFFGEKTFEIRNNADRNFQVGDTLLLKAWDGEFTSDFVEKVVSYITDFEQKPGYVVLGLVNHREHELLEKFHRTGVAIERAISTGSVLANHPLKSRLELLANHHDHEIELAAKLSDATHQCGVMADLLREVTKMVPAIGVEIDDLPVVDAFLERIEAALSGKLPGPHVIEPDNLRSHRNSWQKALAHLAELEQDRDQREYWEHELQAMCAMYLDLDRLTACRDTEWTDAASTTTAADYRELQDQHDQVQSRLKAALDMLREARISVEFRHSTTTNFGGTVTTGRLLEKIDALLADRLPDPAMTVTETIRTAPERIWLQVGDQEHYHSEPFPRDTSEVSWCADSVVGCEVPYVRADLAGRAQAPTLPEDWELVSKATCFTLVSDGQVIASIAGPNAEATAALLANALKRDGTT